MSAEKNNEEFTGFGQDFSFATAPDQEIEEERPQEAPFTFDEDPIDGGFAGHGASQSHGHSSTGEGLFEHDFEDDDQPASPSERLDPESERGPDLQSSVFSGFDAPKPRVGSPSAAPNVFADDEVGEDHEEYEEQGPGADPVVERKGGISSYVKYGAIAAGMLVIAGGATLIDWAALLGGGQEYQVAAPATLDDGLNNLRPVDGKAWEAGQSAPALPPISTVQPVVPALPVDAPRFPSQEGESSTLASTPAKGVLSALPGASASQDEDTNALGSLPAMPSMTSPAQDAISSEDVAALRREIDELRTRLASLEERPSTPSPVVEPPAKPEVVDGWSLKGVFGETAWLNQKGQSGDPREVTIGDSVDGLGKVKDITRYEGNWIVVTDLGVVVRD